LIARLTVIALVYHSLLISGCKSSILVGVFIFIDQNFEEGLELSHAIISLLESISSTFYAHIFRTKFLASKFQNPKNSFVVFGAKILYEKRVHKMLMKLTPVVIFTNIY